MACGYITAKVLTVLNDKIKAAVLYSSVSADFADVIGRWRPDCVGDSGAEGEYPPSTSWGG